MEKKWWTLLGVCGGTFMLLLDTTIVYVVMPPVQRDLKASFADVQWVIDAYALALASFLLTGGTLADRFGRRRLYAIGVGVFTFGSLLCGLAQGPLMLILARLLQGIGGSVMFATGLALVAVAFPPQQRGMAFGIWGMVTGLASAVGPVAGGLIVSGINWRGIFFINVPIGVAVAVIVAKRVDEVKSPNPRKLDWPGFLLLTAGLATGVYGLIRAGETHWSDGVAVAGLLTGAVLLIGFLVVESLLAQPMFDLKLFRIPTFVGGSIAALAMNGSLFAMFLFLALYFQDVLGYSSLQTGLRLLTASLSMLVASIVAGRLSAKLPARVLIGGGLLVVGTGLALMTGVEAGTGWTHFVPGLVVGGVGAGLVNPPLASTAVGVVDLSRSGMASGVNGTFRQVGISAGVAVLGSVFAAIVTNRFTSAFHGTALAGRAAGLAGEARAEGVAPAAATAPGFHAQVTSVATAGFADGINTLLTVSAVVAFVGGLASLVLIRGKDFQAGKPQPAPKLSEVKAVPAKG